MRTLGVAIPCYKYHIPLLKRCLDSIEAQTHKPDQVVVSCSSCEPTDIPSFTYSFPLKIVATSLRQNAAQNRNRAAAELTTDLVSFFDVDDAMHPQRIEMLVDEDYGIALHAYVVPCEHFPPAYAFIDSQTNQLRKGPTGCAVLGDNASARIHHAHATVRRDLLHYVQFRTDRAFERREDALFCGDILALPGITSLYIANPLSLYHEEGATRT
jgi:hypothetical protein